eukprot:4183859-Ditylum_brightwellii.AAC.1
MTQSCYQFDSEHQPYDSELRMYRAKYNLTWSSYNLTWSYVTDNYYSILQLRAPTIQLEAA